MCGVFGGLKNFSKDKIRLLGVLNETRGTHGSGLWDGESILKVADIFTNLIKSGGYDFIENSKNITIGHTRLATCGAKTSENSHPFQFGNIVGVHNGQIRNFKSLKKKYKVKHLKVDSEIIFYLLDKKGVEGLKELIGYYSLIWQDLRDLSKVYLIQHECDLAYVRTKDSLYFSSDSEDLYTVVGYDYKIIESIENTLYTIEVETLKIKQENIKGLKDDTGLNYSKSKYSTSSSSKANMGIGCDLENAEWNTAYDYSSWEKDTKKEYYSTLDKSKDTPYYYRCPTCHEYLTESEVMKGLCGVCRTELSAVVYKCYDCGGKMLLEDLIAQEDDKCINCGGRTECLVKGV